MSFLEVVLAVTLVAALNSIVQAVMARYVITRIDRAMTAAGTLATQLEQLLRKGVPGPGERGSVPVAPGDQAESPGPGSAL